VVDADGNAVDLSLPQPESDEDVAEGAEPEEAEGSDSDGPVAEAVEPAEAEAVEEEPAS
jgi:hypothetical protein